MHTLQIRTRSCPPCTLVLQDAYTCFRIDELAFYRARMSKLDAPGFPQRPRGLTGRPAQLRVRQEGARGSGVPSGSAFRPRGGCDALASEHTRVRAGALNHGSLSGGSTLFGHSSAFSGGGGGALFGDKNAVFKTKSSEATVRSLDINCVVGRSRLANDRPRADATSIGVLHDSAFRSGLRICTYSGQ
jgi:hypothetical protein